MSTRRTTLPTPPTPRLSVGSAFLLGCSAGVVGVLTMTVGEHLEKSYGWGWNTAMHYGQGALAGGIRGAMALLAIDQTLENLTGVGALPWTWPVGEQVADVIHKTVFAFVTGYFADRWIR